MLTFRQLDDAPQRIDQVMAEVEQNIINDMARRIGRMGYASDATQWQLSRLEALSASEAVVREKLYQALNITEEELVNLFDEAATRSLAFDDRVYKAAGYDPAPLVENLYLQQIVQAGLKKTLGTFENLTRTTANTASRMFENVLDVAHQEIVSGGMDYKSAIKRGIRELTINGLPAITYPTGHVDCLDVAFRRATLTGVNQTAAELQIARMEEMGCDLVETTAHPGARPDHQVWQGKWFSYSGKNPNYPDFVSNTGYGTGPGLCGWNCRHSFFPVIEGLSNHEYSAKKLREYNNKKVTFNGQKMDLYEATQQQRYIERMIRKWKREESAFGSAGLDSSGARGKVREWQARQRDFVKQTGLRRDYFRERAGKQNLENLGKGDIINLLSNKGKYKSGNPAMPQTHSAPNATLPANMNLEGHGVRGVLVAGVDIVDVKTIAGYGTNTAIRDLPRLDALYGNDPARWEKKAGWVRGEYFDYEIHWYDNENFMPDGEVKIKGVKKK